MTRLGISLKGLESCIEEFVFCPQSNSVSLECCEHGSADQICPLE